MEFNASLVVNKHGLFTLLTFYKCHFTSMKTKTILGYKVTLEVGKRYIASRPPVGEGILKGRKEWFPVMVALTDNPRGNVYVDDMPYDKANEFLNAFNNGTTTFEGRIW